MSVTKKTKKRIWQTLLLIGLLLELALIAITLKSMIEGGGEALEKQQIFFFCALAIWIYIAFLKQRSIDLSRHVVDEKIKTHLLVNNLREGILLLDSENKVMMINDRAAAITGLNAIDALGGNLASYADASITTLLNSGRSGEATGFCNAGGNTVHAALILLPPDREGETHKLLYVSKHDAPPSTHAEYTEQNKIFILRETVERLNTLADELFTRTPDFSRSARAGIESRLHAFRLLGVLLHKNSPESLFPDLSEKTDIDLFAMIKKLIEHYGNAFDLKWDFPALPTPLIARANLHCVNLAIQQVIANAVAAGMGGKNPLTLRLAPLGANAGFSVLDGGPTITETDFSGLFRVPFVDPAAAENRPISSGLFAARRMIEAQGGALTVAPGAKGGLLVTIMIPGAS